MAGMKSIDDVRGPLEEDCLQLRLLIAAFSDLAGESDPPWLWLVRQKFDALDERVQAYITAVHEHARPVLNDLAKLTR